VLANQIELDVIQNPYRNLGSAGLNGITASVYTGGTDLSDFSILNTPNASHIPNGGYGLPSAANQATQAGAQMPGQPREHPGRPLRRHRHQRPRHQPARRGAVRYRAQLRRIFLSGLQAGMRYENNKYTSSGSRNTSLGANTGNVTPACRW
jgi:phage tail tape-measure protein